MIKSKRRCRNGDKSRQFSNSHSIASAVVTICIVLSATATHAFVPQSASSNRAVNSLTTPNTQSIVPTRTSSSTSTLLRAIPQIDEWEVLRSGAVKGTILNHPTLPDGYEITTSPLDDKKSKIQNNSVVVTASGSKYKLLLQLQPKQRPSLNIFGGSGGLTPNQVDKAKATSKPAAAAAKKQAKPAPKPSPFAKKPAPKPTPKPVAKKVAAPKPAPKPKPAPVAKKAPAPTKNYNLNGKIVGSGGPNEDIYLLVGNLIKSSSKRSQIYYAYKADSNNNPTGPKLTIKLTNSVERLSREDQNYNRVFSKGRVLFSLQGSGSCYVKKVAFLPNVDASPSTKGVSKGNSALLLESGDENLRNYLSTKTGGLNGSQLRRAAVAIARCVEAMHSSGLVWTDLKAENFVLVGQEVKGIDLESAVPAKSSPEDYSPEACPPEFAMAEKRGQGFAFEVQKNYDSWSLGMLFYELATGKNYFAGQSESAIFNLLAECSSIVDPDDPTTVKGLNQIRDDRFRDLVKQCLQLDPKKRPSIESILLHPYFLTTGLGPLTF